jgi:hypothetical protein
MDAAGRALLHEITARRPGRRRFAVRGLLARFGRLFQRNGRTEAVTTTVRFDAAPAAVWDGLLFYEEVPRRPLWLLRLFLPRPIRTLGKQTEVGATIECVYEDGHMLKRITAAQPARLVRFDVIDQDLGIEHCVSMDGGSYEIRPCGFGSEVALTTLYRGHLRPRWLWRPLERSLAHRVHRHILDGMRATVAR